MPFIFVGAVLLKQALHKNGAHIGMQAGPVSEVILAGVYNDYSKHAKNFLIEGGVLCSTGEFFSCGCGQWTQLV